MYTSYNKAKIYDRGGNVVNIAAFGAKADGVSATCTVTGGTTVTATTSVFSAADVGKVIYLNSCGTASTSTYGLHKTTIAGYTSPTVVTITNTVVNNGSGVSFFFGTDNTAAIQATIDFANSLGGGKVVGEAGNYIVTSIAMKKKVTFQGSSLDSFVIWSAIASGNIVSMTSTINTSTAVYINVEDMTIRGLDYLGTAAGFCDVGGTYVIVRRVKFLGCIYDCILDQTELAAIDFCTFEGRNTIYFGAMDGSEDPSQAGGTSWTKTGTGGASDGRWNINVTSAALYYLRSAGTDLFSTGLTFQGKMPEVVSGTQIVRFDDGTRRYDITFSTSAGVSLNGGSVFTGSLSGYVKLIVAAGGATADLYLDGTKVASAVAYLASSTPNTCVLFGNLSGTSNVYWNRLEYQSCSQLPACLWLVDGDSHTTGANAEFTNVITVRNCQFNSDKYHVADDGGYGHRFENNNHNGGLIHYRIGGSYVVDIANADYEACKWEVVYVAAMQMLKNTPLGSPHAITIRGGLIGSPITKGFPVVNLLQTYNVDFKSVRFPSVVAGKYAVRLSGSGAVSHITATGCTTGGGDLFNSVTNEYPRLYTDNQSQFVNGGYQYRMSSKITLTTAASPTQITANTNNYNPSAGINDGVSGAANGSITSGQAVLTSAVYPPFSSASIGSCIKVAGAGAAGADLVATISGYTNATTVTLDTNAGTTVTTANVTVYNPIAMSILRLNSNAAVNLTGIMRGGDGHNLAIYNTGSNNITLKHQDTGSAACNRFLNTTLADIVLSANQKANLWYDAITLRWRVDKAN